MRSIFAPHRVIRTRVGIRVASKNIKKDRILSEENVRMRNNIIADTRMRNLFWVL